MSGQADTAPASSLDDVAQLLFDNEGADAPIDERSNARGSEPEEDNSEPAEELADDESDEQPGPDDEPEGDEPEGDAQSPTSKDLIEVRVAGADGAEVTEKVTLDELKASYLRHSDYTRKTMELGERERQATELVSTKLNEGRTHYLQEAEKAHRAIVMLAALRSPEEMAVLAQTDPSAWVAENARTQAIQGVLNQIEQGMRTEAQQGQSQTLEQQRAAYTSAWGELGKHGIDRPKLVEIFEGVHSTYGVPKDKLTKVTDPALVQIMNDAMQFRALQTRAATLKKTVEKAPPMPAARQPIPQQTRVSKQLNARFNSGKASTRDLGKWLEMNG